MRFFLIIVLVTVVGLACYVSWHLWRLTPGGWPLKLAVSGLFLLWMVIGFTCLAWMERVPVGVATVWYEVGHPWMIACLYLLLIFVAADLATLCRLLPKDLLKDSAAALAAVTGLVAVIMILGGVHYRHKYREEMTVRTDKPLEKPLTLVLASDLHVGYHIRRAEIARWVDLINAEQPDLVLLAGDIVDRSLRPVFEGHYAEEFRRIAAPVWAVCGNHEYYSDPAQAERFLAEAGIRLLKDSTARFRGIDVIGRKDRSVAPRQDLATLAAGLDGFTLVLDHQPFHLEEAEAAGIDFQFSGHTHHGQVWPASLVTDALYEKAWGHHRRGRTQYYVSSGLGIWGAKIRIGTRSEYLVLHVTN